MKKLSVIALAWMALLAFGAGAAERPMLVVIESHDEVDKEIKTYFTAHRYSAIEPYSQLDPLNDYYVPAEQVAAFDARMAEESAMTAPASGTAGPVDEKDEQ